MSRPYIHCQRCGAHLDPGEHCDCKDKHKRESGHTAGEYADNPTENPHMPVLTPGA